MKCCIKNLYKLFWWEEMNHYNDGLIGQNNCFVYHVYHIWHYTLIYECRYYWSVLFGAHDPHLFDDCNLHENLWDFKEPEFSKPWPQSLSESIPHVVRGGWVCSVVASSLNLVFLCRFRAFSLFNSLQIYSFYTLQTPKHRRTKFVGWQWDQGNIWCIVSVAKVRDVSRLRISPKHPQTVYFINFKLIKIFFSDVSGNWVNEFA